YQPTAKKGVETPILSIQYKVGYNCDRDTTLATGMSYSGSRGPGSYPTKGPSITVAKNTSTTVLATVLAGVKVDQTVPLNATVTGGIDGDIVEFYDGTTKLGQGTLAAGKATFAWSPALGAHSVTAKFLGTTKATESVSAAQNVTVSPADVTTTTTVSGDATGVVGTNVALSAKVSPAPALGGTVQFKDGATNIGGLVDLDAHGNAATTVPLAAGTHAITAVFTGVGEYQPSTSTAPHNVTVTPANVATITTITGDTTAVTDTDAVLNVQVSPAPTGGTVQFKNGTTNIGNPVTLD
ncbi:hypothetical protein B2J88_52235, partial [Rhodococcus sp. SRB_17]|nr:hypothetical protein [Rhodococcus sp. SRB_17]